MDDVPPFPPGRRYAGVGRCDHRLEREGIALVMKHRMLPPQAERIIACMHVAMFDAVNALDRRYQPYGISISAPKDASKEAAAAAAAGGVLAQLFPHDGEELRAALSSYLAPIPEGPAKSAGIKAWGRRRCQDAHGPPGRRCRCARCVSAEDKAGRLRADADHGFLDVAQGEALCDDEPFPVSSAASDRADQRGMGG